MMARVGWASEKTSLGHPAGCSLQGTLHRKCNLQPALREIF
jgi:hypothetical protein